MINDIRFEFETQRLEVYKDAGGRPHIRGIASDSLDDRQGDAITETCIANMARQLNRGIPLLPDHRSSFEIGTSTLGEPRRNPMTGALELIADFALDDRFVESSILYDEIESGKCKRQLSIGGFLNKKNPRAAYLEQRNGKTLTILDDINLDHIAVTREGRAANPRTGFLDAIRKAINDAGMDVTSEGIVDRVPASPDSSVIYVPSAIAQLATKDVEAWKSIWKDTFVRQVHVPDQSIESAEATATGVATVIISKHLNRKIEIDPNEHAVNRTHRETYIIGTTSKAKDGHSHLWIGKEVGERILDGLMLTVKGHDHKILETGKCDSDSGHEHTLVHKDKKVVEPSTELSAPVGLLHFGKGYDSENDVRAWLDANGIEPLNVTRMSDSIYVVEFSLPFGGTTETGEAASKEGPEMPRNKGKSPEDAVEKATVPYRAWPMSDERSWSWTAADGNRLLGEGGDDWGRFKTAHTYFDDSRGQTPEIKAAYSLPHHKAANGGLETYVGGVIAATAILNGARGGFRRETSAEGRQALYTHLSKHYTQAGREAPPLKSDWLDRVKEDFTHPNPKTLAERDFEDFLFSLEKSGFKDNVPDFLNKDWWLTWDSEQTGVEEIPEREKGIWMTIEKATVDHGEDQPVETEQAAEAEQTKDNASGKTDDNPAGETETAPTPDNNPDLTSIERGLAELADATKKALADITGAVLDIGKRVAALETRKDDSAEQAAPVEPVASAEPAAPAEAAPSEPAAASDQSDAGAKAPETAAEDTSSQTSKDAKTNELFSAFHDLLSGMGMTAKDFFASLVQKNLEGTGPSLAETVHKAVESSISALHTGVTEKVEKSLDAKLADVAKEFATTIEKLNGRLEKVEQVGGVPGGAAGQEGSSETTRVSRGTFAGIFSSALRK